jgi:CRISPR-associated protein Cmr2
MQHLLLIHIGPVQDFIASARRSRDLWFGSWLLSELSKTAARAIQEQEGTIESLIFPAPSDESWLKANSEFNVANKVVALIQKSPETLADEVEKAVRKRLETIRQDAFDHVSGPFDREIAEAQVDDLLEYFWIAVPVEGISYATAREQTEALMAARKSTRNFNPVRWGSNTPKSSLDGSRESVIPESKYPSRSDNEQRRQDKIKVLYAQYGARAAERLSGVDLLKRLGQRGPESRFPSTSHVASLPFLVGLGRRTGIVTHWNEYVQNLPQQTKEETIPERFAHPIFDTTDGSIFFESRLAESLEGEALQTAAHALRQFLKNAADGKSPIPYYALLLADGDRMGQVINTLSSPQQHRQLSRALAEFASQVQTIVEQDHGGALVYAGGDDVLAFLPLHTVLDCAWTLADTFRGQMRDFKDEDGKSPTFSAGIAVNHHLEPLSDALDFVRQAEHKAKAVPGKDALAVAVIMRGGVPRIVAEKRDVLNEHLNKFIKFHRQDALPDGAAYQLRDVAFRLGEKDIIRQSATLQDALRRESIRILTRKRAERGTRGLAEEVLKGMKTLIEGTTQSIEQLADELIIARLFANAYDQAHGLLE